MKKFLNWIIYSSNNASKYSLSIKGLAGFIPMAVGFFTFLHLNVEPGSLLALIDAIAAFVTAIGAAVTACYTLFGVIRKLYKTLVGTNDVINSQ